MTIEKGRPEKSKREKEKSGQGRWSEQDGGHKEGQEGQKQREDP